MKLLIIDTETGGLDPIKHSILSLGAVVWEDGVLGEEFEVLIREDPIIAEPRALEVNGIDVETHRGATPTMAVDMLNVFLLDQFEQGEMPIVLGGHNTHFDIGFLKRLFGLAGRVSSMTSLFSHRIMDTMIAARFLRMAGKIPEGKEGLSCLLEYFNIQVEPGKRHSALADARATGTLLTCLIEAAKSDCWSGH